MPTTDVLLMFFATAVVLAIMPGPGLFYVIGRTLAEGPRFGLASSLGAGLGGLIHVAAGAVGVSALIMASASAFTALKVCGGVYLLYLAYRTWTTADGQVPMADARGSDNGNLWQATRQGVVVEATNPKTAAFFLSVLPQFIDPAQGSTAIQFAVLGLISVVISTINAMVVTLLASSARHRLIARPSLFRRVQQGSAAILASLAVWLLLSSRKA